MQLKQLELLDQIRALISTPETWCKDAAARNAKGKPVFFNSDHAVRWCVAGARCRVAVVGPTTDGGPLWARVQEKAQAIYRLHPTEVNDDLGHAAVLALLDAVRADLVADDGEVAP